MLGHWYVILILALLALIIFGPRRLPELGEGLGKAIREFRKATTDVSQSIRDEVQKAEPPAAGTTYTPGPGEPPHDPPKP